jgi:hypothetical protein
MPADCIYRFDFTVPLVPMNTCYDTALDSSKTTKYPSMPNQICNQFYWKKVYRDNSRYLTCETWNDYNSIFYVNIDTNAYGTITLPRNATSKNNIICRIPEPRHYVDHGHERKYIYF